MASVNIPVTEESDVYETAMLVQLGWRRLFYKAYDCEEGPCLWVHPSGKKCTIYVRGTFEHLEKESLYWPTSLAVNEDFDKIYTTEGENNEE